MQLLNINVAKTTETSVTVEFKGDGNDLITVRMSANPELTEEQVVKSALDMLRELTFFRSSA